MNIGDLVVSKIIPQIIIDLIQEQIYLNLD